MQKIAIQFLALEFCCVYVDNYTHDMLAAKYQSDPHTFLTAPKWVGSARISVGEWQVGGFFSKLSSGPDTRGSTVSTWGGERMNFLDNLVPGSGMETLG